MLTVLRRVAFSVLAFASGLASAGTLYTYTGPAYDSATGLYTTAMRISGSFTTAAPLPPNLAPGPIGPGAASNLVTGWSFTDGVNTYTDANSMVLFGNPIRFSVSTDASGNISGAIVAFMSPPGSHTVGQLMSGIALSFAAEATTTRACEVVTSNVCTSFTGDTSNYAIAPLGIWTKSEIVANPVPALGKWGLLVLAGLLILAVGFKLRPRTV